VEMVVGATPFPAEISLRKLNDTAPGGYNEGYYGLNLMLARRGDARVKSVLDLSIDFEDLDGDGVTNEHISFVNIADDATGSVAQKSRPGVTPSVGFPATPSGLSLDTQGQAAHLFRMQAIREIVARVLAEYDLDALVYPYETIPSKILTGTSGSISWLSYDGRPNRGYNGFTDTSGLPDIGVPAGFTKVVYDRTTRGAASEELALNPPAEKREVLLPFSVQFVGRPWSEPTLIEIAAAYEHARGPRVAPPGFGPIPGEP
jgi:Asp-tRNA(Asn)/Glu-tRNA(Gln) amidotransferase A subunit family amidase